MRLRVLCKSKIHRAKITDANPEYVGSILIPIDLLEMVDILPGEQVAVWDVTNGARLETYALPGPRGSSDIVVNGAGAHRIFKGDTVIIAAFLHTDEPVAPRYILVDDRNRFAQWLSEAPEG